MDYTQIFLAVIAVAQILFAVAVIILVAKLLPQISALQGEVAKTTQTARGAILRLEQLLANINDSNLVPRVSRAIDEIGGDLTKTLTEARSLLDNATQTSQSVRERVDDLATTQKELTHLAGSLADVASQVRDQQLVKQLNHVLSDTSLLAADIGMLAENANSYLEHGKPLVSNVSKVVSNAKDRASSITTRLGSLRESVSSEQQSEG